MKILILGANGMLGHKLMQTLSQKFSVSGTVRGDATNYTSHTILSEFNIIGNIRADDLDSLQRLLDISTPDVIINGIGIVKQLPASQDPLQSIVINALFPHQLAKICRERHIRFIHMGTDCIFSGKKGNYSENDPSDADDLYGKTKFLGEVDYPGCLTIRTSIIGREIGTNHGLLQWFLNQEGTCVKGYTNAIFSGLTTLALAEIILKIIVEYPILYGIYQVASEPISKFDLLQLVKSVYKLKITIEPDESVTLDRSLNPEKFKRDTNIQIPSWEYMINQIYLDPTTY